jgi:hypothetical protein
VSKNPYAVTGGIRKDLPPPEPIRSLILSRLLAHPKISGVWCDADKLSIRHDAISDPYRITWKEAAELVDLLPPPQKERVPILNAEKTDRVRRRLKTLRPRTSEEAANRQQRVN